MTETQFAGHYTQLSFHPADDTCPRMHTHVQGLVAAASGYADEA